MADRINVFPDELRQAACGHRETAETLARVPSQNAAVMATLESLGPVFAELREAGRGLLDQRRICYQQQAAAHAALADQLSNAADVWDQHDSDAAHDLQAITRAGS